MWTGPEAVQNEAQEFGLAGACLLVPRGEEGIHEQVRRRHDGARVPVVALVHEVHLQREALARDAVLGAGVEGDTLQRELAIVQRQPSEAAIAQVCGDGVSIVLDLPAPISLSLSEQSDLSLKNIETSFLISHNECCYRR